ncbi:hypothetical protein [Bradyrhizobium sp. CCBAU 11357]|uniref:hypothetical protein n=1 Tax=Bradyrhizobium sp. CCBAU 11357 TaxID=1630808 RepID=UPI0023020782|nr:hypothetical protein [Bradyrhizobium sp. CCBAU 11357]
MWLMSPGVTRFASTDYRNGNCPFAIKDEDRFSHLYIIGKTVPERHVREDRIALAASGFIEVFKKMWPDAWGVRMEHIFATF